MLRRISILFVSVFLLMGFTACLEEDAVDPRVIEVEVGESYFEPEEITVSPEETIAIQLTNVGEETHSWGIDNFDGEEIRLEAEPGETNELIFTAPNEPGVFEAYCSEPGHREQGEVGTVIVESPNATGLVRLVQ